jgi:hypothetical protein
MTEEKKDISPLVDTSVFKSMSEAASKAMSMGSSEAEEIFNRSKNFKMPNIEPNSINKRMKIDNFL